MKTRLTIIMFFLSALLATAEDQPDAASAPTKAMTHADFAFVDHVDKGDFALQIVRLDKIDEKEEIKTMIKLHSQGIGAGAAPQNLPRELIGSHHGAMGQTGHANGDGSILFNENDCTLGGLELKPDGTLIVPFAQKGEAKPVDDIKETGVVPNQGEAVVGLEARSDSDWLDLGSFGEKLETLPKSHYPFEIQGRPLKGDGTQWRAFFAQIPDDQFQYRVAFGKTDKEYTTLWRKYKKEGFTCIDHQSFTAMSGTLHQAIWVNTKAQKQFKTLTTEIDQLSPDQRNVTDPLKAIRDPSAAVRYFAICKLDPANSEKHEDALLAGLDDDICWLRYAAAVRLADTKRNVDIIAPILVESLGHDDNTFFPWDTRFVYPALHKIGDAALVHLNATIDSPNRTLRSRGCYMMGSMFSVSKDRKLYQKTLEALNEAISNNMFPSSRPMYVTTRMKIDGDIDRAEKLIREDAQSNDVAICRAALAQMKHFDSAGERFLPLIIKTLEERKEYGIVRAAVNALWRIHDGHRSSVGVPVDLSSCVPSIVVQLEQQKDVRLQGHLLRFLEDTDNAKHCPVEPIIEILSGKDDVNHDAALEVLYAMGLSARPAQSILWKMRDSDRSMSKDQRELLMSLITFLRYGHK